jgi:hypothetical protein
MERKRKGRRNVKRGKGRGQSIRDGKEREEKGRKGEIVKLDRKGVSRRREM